MISSKHLIILLCLKLIIVCNAQTWSTWRSCSHPESCQNKTELICDNGRGVQCLQNGISPYQITLPSSCNRSCDAFDNSQWEGIYILLECRGDCYDAMQINESSCKFNQTCKRQQFYRCYNEQTCRGTWKETSSQCSSSCGGGIRQVIRTCINQTSDQKSSDCNGTFYGTYSQMNISQPCNTHACSTPTPGNKSTPCSVSCGNATQTSNVPYMGFPVLYVTIGCGAFLFLIIIVIIIYVVIKKRNSSNKISPNDLTSNDIYGSGNKETNANGAPINADTVVSDFGDMYAEINKNKETETKSHRDTQNTVKVTLETRDIYAEITEDDKPEIINQESEHEDAVTSQTDEVYAVVNKTNKMETESREKNQDESM